MFGGIDKTLFLNRIVSPKQEHQAFALLREALNGAVCEGFPAMTLVRSRLMGAHRERSVEQQHTLVRPRLQITASRWNEPNIRTQLLEDILQRLRNRHAVLHRETQSVRLPFPMIRVLADNHDLHLVKRRGIERIENFRSRRKYEIVFLLLYQKGFQFRKIRSLELVPEDFFPGFVDVGVD